MKEFYLVSINELKVNQKLNLSTKDIPYRNNENIYTKNEVKDKFNELYPNGISKHGIRYLTEKFDFPNFNGKGYVPYIAMIELTFELIRKTKFKDKPSRFVSVFGCETLEQAVIFKEKYRDNQGLIYKVVAEKWSKFDMNFLYLGMDIIGNQILIEKYWNGVSSKNPFWEILMTGEIKVVKKIL